MYIRMCLFPFLSRFVLPQAGNDVLQEACEGYVYFLGGGTNTGGDFFFQEYTLFGPACSDCAADRNPHVPLKIHLFGFSVVSFFLCVLVRNTIHLLYDELSKTSFSYYLPETVPPCTIAPLPSASRVLPGWLLLKQTNNIVESYLAILIYQTSFPGC